MGLFKDKKYPQEAEAIDKVKCEHTDGLPNTYEHMPVELFALTDRLFIKVFPNNFELLYTQIDKIEYLSEQQIEEIQKSSVGRAAAGLILLGPLGAIIGGISGVGTKKRYGPNNQYIIINYHSLGSSNIKVMSFKNNFNLTHMQNFVDLVNGYINPQKKQNTSGTTINL